MLHLSIMCNRKQAREHASTHARYNDKRHASESLLHTCICIANSKGMLTGGYCAHHHMAPLAASHAALAPLLPLTTLLQRGASCRH